jgi:hypothetical protein
MAAHRRGLEANSLRAVKEATQSAPSQPKPRTIKMHLASRAWTPARNCLVIARKILQLMIRFCKSTQFA